MIEIERTESGHRLVRRLMRVAGTLLVLLGFVALAVATVDLFAALDNDGPPRHLWGYFMAVPLWLVGRAVFQLGRMTASAHAPAVADVAAPVSGGTSGSSDDTLEWPDHDPVGILATGTATETADGRHDATRAGVPNPLFAHEDEPYAKFADDRGPLKSDAKECSACGELNDADAKFCDQCGRRFSEVALGSSEHAGRRGV